MLCSLLVQVRSDAVWERYITKKNFTGARHKMTRQILNKQEKKMGKIISQTVCLQTSTEAYRLTSCFSFDLPYFLIV